MVDKYLCPECGWIVIKWEKQNYSDIKTQYRWRCFGCKNEYGRNTEKPEGNLELLTPKWFYKQFEKMNLKEGDVLFNKRRKTFFRIIKLFSDDKKNKESYIHFISANRKTKDDALKTNMTSIIDTDRIVLDCKKINLKNRVDR